jgi:hypothetical protein
MPERAKLITQTKKDALILQAGVWAENSNP